jgi:dipeptidyl aminopeptidase/acylaminoacyl peptidase
MKRPLFDDDALWKRRFRATMIESSQIAARNPTRGLVVRNWSGHQRLYAWDVETGNLRQMTDDPAGKGWGGISPDGNFVYYHQDDGGNEIGRYVRIPFTGGAAEVITPDLAPYSTLNIGASLNGKLLGFSAVNDDGFTLYTQKLHDDGTIDAPQILYRSARHSYGPLLDVEGRYAVIATTERSPYYEHSLIAFDLTAGESLTARVLQEDEGSVRPIGFAPIAGDGRLLATTNATGFARPVIWDVTTGDRTDIPLTEFEGDLEAWDWSPDGTRILLSRVNRARYEMYVYDLERSTLKRLDCPTGTYSRAYFVPGADEIFADWQDARTPQRMIALDAETGQLRRVVLSAEEDVPQSKAWQSVEFVSSGGAQIQAWLATPDGDPPYPAIIHAHGGPDDAQTETFDTTAQCWLDHGFAWLSVNYRGSTSFGREFEQAIWGIFGHREVDDLAAAHNWLIREGIAQADAIFLHGRGYGGYLTLQALGRRPDLWAGGIAEAAIADWTLLYADGSETIRGYLRAAFGGTPEEKPDLYRASSPLIYAEAVSAPMLIINGRNDTRCPPRQMEAYMRRLQEQDKPVEIHWYDAGHAGNDGEQAIERQEMALRFVIDAMD